MIGRWTVLNGVLLAIVLLLGVQIARTWMRTVPPMRTPAPEAEVPRRDGKKRVVTERAEQTDQMVSLITNQDLFDASRQAVGSGGPVAAAEVPPPTGIELVGIRLLGGDQEALIRDQSQQNAQRRVREGDEVAGHTVQSINATNVELLNPNGQAVTLWLQLAPSAAKPAAPGGRPGVPAPAPRPGGVPPAPARTPAPPPPAQGGATPPPMDPRAAERQRLRQQRLERRGGELKPNLPEGIQERLNQLRKGA